MADEREALTFFPILSDSTRKKGNHDTCVGLKKIHKPLILPSLDLRTVDLQLVSSLFSHKQICKKVTEWFVGWRSWQQKILLCGVSERCSKDQLKALLTTLEPVFHRDFTTRLKGIYPTTLIRPPEVKTAPAPSFSAEELANTLLPKLSDEIHVDDSSITVARDIDHFENGETDILQLTSDLFQGSDSDEYANVTIDDRNNMTTRGKAPGALSRDTSLVSVTLSTHTVQRALDVEESRRHEHAAPCLRRVSTPHFFPQFGHRQLGLMKSTPRIGDTDRLYGNAPVTFKHDKWWEGHKGTPLIKPRRSKLSNHFKSQITQIYQWLDDWQVHERVDLLSEVVKCCNEECLNFFAQCLEQRLRDQTDLNCVPDHVLLNVFSYLNIQSLCRSSQVCNRWRFLANDSKLWKDKIASLGASEGVKNLTRRIEFLGRGQAVDWKQAYKEVHIYYKEMVKAKLAEQQEKDQKATFSAERQEERKHSINIEVPSKTMERGDCKTVTTEVADIPFTHSLENIGPAQSAPTTELKECADDFKTSDFDGHDLTGGNLKILSHSLQALAREDKPDDLEVALDVRPVLIQASNLLEEDSDKKRQRFRYLSLAVQGVFAVRRVRRLQGHMDAILCLQFDSRRLVTGSADRTIRVWDVRSGLSIHKLKGHKGGVRCLQFDNEKIVSGSWDMTVMVWDVVRFNRVKVLYGHSGCVSSLLFNDDILVTGSHDCTIRIWSTDSWECEGVIEGHGGAVTSLQLYKEFIISGSIDRTLKLWSLETKKCVETFVGHWDAVLALKVLGNLVLSGSADGMILFWDLETGECLIGIQAHEGPVYSLDYNGHQHFFSSGGDHLLKEWDVGTCTCLRSLQGHKGPVFCVKAAPHRIVSCSADGHTRVWDLDVPDAKRKTKKKITLEENVITPQTVQQSRKSPTNITQEGGESTNAFLSEVPLHRGGRSVVL
ncbi:uncharacterized protein [Montipora capricornis]|uniref:uncharacterized protein isoform X1 n=1 Tax=Montipora capricornis TaxID=246305 RepID=UPI0035F10C91